MKTLFFLGFIFILFSMPVHAQQVAEAQDILGGVWSAIHALQDDVSDLQDQLVSFHQQFLQFKNNVIAHAQDINASITVLNQTSEDLQNQITTTNVQVQENTDSIAAHTQQLDDVNQTIETLKTTDQQLAQTDDNLQNQINGISIQTINRSQVYEVVNTNLSENTAFCADNLDILLFGYCAGGFLGESPPTATVFYDAFTDYEYNNNPPWIMLAGPFIVGGPTGGPSDGELVCASVSVCEASASSVFLSDGFSFETQMYANQSGDELFMGVTDKAGYIGQSLDSGYMLRAYIQNTGSTLTLYRLDGGAQITLIAVPINIPIQTDFIVKAERDSGGLWQIYLDGFPVGDSIIDSAHSNFSNVHLRYDGYQNLDAGTFDKIKINSLDTPLGANGFLNVNDLNSPLGIRCQNNGRARILCLQQP